jgi:thiamine-phosphate pyrophosphorylase
MRRPAPGLYLIVDPVGHDRHRREDLLDPLLGSGVTCVQLRDKQRTPGRSPAFARHLLERCRAHGLPLIVNDDPGWARELGADGVHLGQEDHAIRDARRMLGPEAWIGASAYADLQRAQEAIQQGADYIAFGSFFPSATKPRAPRATLDLLREARRTLDRPICAIGGIRADNARSLMAAGADWVAVISAVWDAPDPVAAIRALVAACASTRGEEPAPP